jgi:hypothetical protein
MRRESGQNGRWEPNWHLIVAVWIGWFAVGVTLAAVFPDNNPRTDDAAGMGALVFVVGMAFTAIYFVIGLLFGRKK